MRRVMNIKSIRIIPRLFLVVLILCVSISASQAQEDHIQYEYKNGNVIMSFDNLEDTVLLDGLLQSTGTNKAITDSLSGLSGRKVSPSGWELIDYNDGKIVYRKSIKDFKSESTTRNFFFDYEDKALIQNHNLDVASGINHFKKRKPSVKRKGKEEEKFTFKLIDRDYEQVYLSGSFNNWSTLEYSMHLNDGIWRIDVKLDKGKNLYKFIVDGKWMIDAENEMVEEDWDGNMNSVYFNTNYSFELENYDEAKEVYVAGSFNGWDPKAFQLKWINGKWSIDLYLREGLYSYKFIVDGVWIIDPANPLKVPNEYGSENSLISFGEQTTFKLKNYKDAKKVVLTGDFNAWEEAALSMKKGYEGWEISVAVRPGNYDYKFIVDGKWIIDPDNPIHNGKGDYQNSVISIEANHTFVLKGYENAQNVFLSGTFNNWAEQGYTMQKENGNWVLKVYLPKGKTRYKFIVDGEWIIDPANPLWEDNGMDSNDSVLWIE
jgi:hypothetical protein